MRYIPSPADYVKALNATGSMMLLKLSLIRSVKSALIFVGGLAFALLAVLAASHTGEIIRDIAQFPRDIAAKQMALNYLASYSRGEMGTLGALTFGLAVYSSILAPFTGVISNSIFSQKNISHLQAPLLTRFTDSFFSQMFSSISLFQLFTLTTMASLITLGSSQSWAMLYVWLSWPILISISVIASWTYESLQRVKNIRPLIIVGAVVLAVFIGFAAYDVNNLGTFFGVGTLYAETIKNIATYTATEKLLAFTIVLLVFAVTVLIGSALSLYALSREEVTVFRKKKERPPVLARRKHSKVYEVEMFSTMATQVLRNPDSIRPIAVLLILGLPIMFLFRSEQVAHVTFLVTIPLIIACSWGVNFLGVLGGGLTLLRNQAHALSSLPWIAALNQVFFTLILFAILWIPPFATGAISIDKVVPYSLAAIATTCLITRSSLSKAIHRPYPTHPGTRGETLVPMGTMIGYTLRMSLWGCQYGIIILYADNLRVQFTMCVFAVLWSLVRMFRLSAYWNKPETQYKAIQAISQA